MMVRPPVDSGLIKLAVQALIAGGALLDAGVALGAYVNLRHPPLVRHNAAAGGLYCPAPNTTKAAVTRMYSPEETDRCRRRAAIRDAVIIVSLVVGGLVTDRL
jgi:hypothetical protein